jgi:hypothetical protein
MFQRLSFFTSSGVDVMSAVFASCTYTELAPSFPTVCSTVPAGTSNANSILTQLIT